MKASFLGEHFCESNSINCETELDVEHVDANKLLTSNRMDLIPKIRFVEDVMSGEYRNNTVEDYKKSIDAFSDGRFCEPGDLKKTSFDAYLNTFVELIDSISKNGFESKTSIVPVGDDNTILDGSHRVAIAIALNKKITIARFGNIIKEYDAKYFMDRGVDTVTVETWVNDYLDRTNNHATFILWPKLTKEQRECALGIIRSSVEKVVYHRTDSYNQNSLHQITAIAYDGHPWTGSCSNKFSGCKQKSREVSNNATGCVTSITVQVEESLAEKIKINIRELLKVGNAGLHSSDNPVESKYLANHFYNHHTRNVLKTGKAFRYPKFLKKLFVYRDNIKSNGLNLDDFIVVSSSVLGLYGLRNPNDIDFLSRENNFSLIENKFIENHHHVMKAYNLTKNDYLSDARNYVYFFGMKIYSIEEMMKSNKNRKENTKFTDIRLAKLRVYQHANYIYWLRFIGLVQRTIRKCRLSVVQFIFILSRWFPVIKVIYRKYFKRV